MNYDELIVARQSVRSFNGEPVEKSQLEAMLIAAQQAPSWKNTQTSRYYVISTQDKVAEFIAAGCLPEFNVNSCKGVGALIVTTFRKNISGFTRETQAPENTPANEWGAYDLGLHDMQLCLKATDLGLDTLIMGIRNEDAIKSFISSPDDEEIMAVIAVGHRDNPTTKPNKKALDVVAKFF